MPCCRYMPMDAKVRHGLQNATFAFTVNWCSLLAQTGDCYYHGSSRRYHNSRWQNVGTSHVVRCRQEKHAHTAACHIEYCVTLS